MASAPKPARPIPPSLPPQVSQPQSSLSPAGAKIESKRRFSIQGTLANDELYVAEQLAKVVEGATPEKTHTEDDRWWSAIFLPLPAPRQLLPEVLIDQKGLVRDPDPREREKVQASVKLTCEELEELVRVCNCFARMVEPPYLEADEESQSAALLTRQSFCQLILSMGLTSMEKCMEPRYHRALECFDAEAQSCEVPGIAPYGRLVMAVRLPAVPEKDNQSALDALVNDRLTPRLTRLFGRLLEDLATNPFWEGQEMAEALPRAKKYFFFKMLPAAQAYGDERLQLLQKKAVQLKQSRQSRSISSSSIQQEERTSGEVDAKAVSHLRGVSAGSATTRSSTSHFTRLSKDLDAISELNEVSSPKMLPMAKPSSGPHLTRPKRELSVKIAEKPPQPEPSMELEEEEEEEVPLPPEMVKAEFMQNQLLEPEVVCFVATFSSLFQVLFEAYCDFPQEPRGYGGHMTISAFLRFCFDFGLFSVIDLQTLQRSYNLCSEDFIPAEPQRRKRRTKGSKREANGVFFWNGLQVPQRFEWLTKEFAQHEAEEAACAGVLGAMHDWMKDRAWTPTDLFTLLDWNCNGGICAEELMAGVQLMRLDNLPCQEELQRLATLLVSQDTGHITSYELQQVLAIIAKQKHKLELAANFFLKADQDMSEVERNASVFFKDLVKVMEKNSWTPRRLFQELSNGGSQGATITKDKLEDKAKVLMRLHCGRTAGLEVAEPFEILDLNGDGVIEEDEFLCIVGQVLKALRTQHREGKQRRQLQAAVTAVAKSWSVSTARAQAASKQGVRFSLASFIECLLLISYEVVGIRGTPTQAQQPSITKAVWLILYLRWQFETKLKQETARVEEELAWASLLGISEKRSLSRYAPPLERLFQRPRLFEVHREASERAAQDVECSGCGRTAHLGRSVTCPQCSDLADVALKACWKSHKACAGQRVSLIKSLLLLRPPRVDEARDEEILS